MNRNQTFAFAAALLLATSTASAQYVTSAPGTGRFSLSVEGKSAPLIVSSLDYPGVRRAASDLQADVKRVTGAAPKLIVDSVGRTSDVVLIGTIGKSPLIDQLISARKIDVSRVQGRWETFLLQSVANPLPGVGHALVIAGSDKRGTIYGIYDLSENIGVSPWYWWADVPVAHRSRLYVLPGMHTQGEPKVKYRGFFINDEAPALSGWVHEKFGNFNHQFYEKVFELLLRMKGNYLWPAMWGNAFNDDDKLNPQLADEYGVVMGTSHHEPMLRAQQEWKRYGKGPWNYDSNADTLKAFWRQGIVNMDGHESIVTVGMRGDGDMPMSQESNIALLERIVADQRKIIADVTGKPPQATPQDWALYKEVQDYYDRGMRVPDDVTLLFADDNWGNIRRLPKPGAAPRSGGYGVYYHFDYVGGPRNYKWINTNQVERVWEQLNLAYEMGARQIWVVNVGDIKPMELPLSFWFAHAWDPTKWTAQRAADYARVWAAQQFGAAHAAEIGDMLSKYTRFNARRKPELLSPSTYSLSNYQESERVVGEYNALALSAEKLYATLAPEYRDAFYQLVLFPIKASANLNELYRTVALNQQYAAQGDADANSLADRAQELFARDARLTAYYNDTLAGGKWHHMMDQTHIGYTSWQEPRTNVMPAVKRVDAAAPAQANVDGVARPARRDIPFNGFVETDGYVSVEAEHFTRAAATAAVHWTVIPNLGRTLSAVSAYPRTIAISSPGANSPHLEYAVHFTSSDSVTVHVYVSPTLDFHDRKGLRFAVSFDDAAPQIVNAWPPEAAKKDNSGSLASLNWEKAVSNNIIDVASTQRPGAGSHVLKLWLVDPGVVFQKIVIDTGGLKPSYLGPPESPHGRGAR